MTLSERNAKLLEDANKPVLNIQQDIRNLLEEVRTASPLVELEVGHGPHIALMVRLSTDEAQHDDT